VVSDMQSPLVALYVWSLTLSGN